MGRLSLVGYVGAAVVGLVMFAAGWFGARAAPVPLAKSEPALESLVEQASLDRRVEAKDAAIEQYVATVNRLNTEIAGLLEKQTALESQVEVLKLKEDSTGALAGCQENADACYAKLQECAVSVGKILLADQEARKRKEERRPRRQGPKDSLVFVRQPYVFIGEGNVGVEGTIHNTNNQSIEGFLLVTLTSGGREIDRATLPMTIGAGSVESWDLSFEGHVTIGSNFRAAAEWDKER